MSKTQKKMQSSMEVASRKPYPWKWIADNNDFVSEYPKSKRKESWGGFCFH